MQEVLALVRHFLVLPGQSDVRLLSPLRSFYMAGYLALQTDQALLCLLEMLGVIDLLPIRCYQEGF